MTSTHDIRQRNRLAVAMFFAWIVTLWLVSICSCLAETVRAIGSEEAASADWVQSYAAGYTDSNGAYAGGSEIMHLVPRTGELYAVH